MSLEKKSSLDKTKLGYFKFLADIFLNMWSWPHGSKAQKRCVGFVTLYMLFLLTEHNRHQTCSPVLTIVTGWKNL